MGDSIKLCSTYLLSMDSLHSCLLAKKSEASPQCQVQYDARFKKHCEVTGRFETRASLDPQG
jgi:hypothetical protein